MRRGMVWLSLLVMLASCILPTELAAAEESLKMGRTEPLYSAVLAACTLPVYGGEEIRVTTDLNAALGETVQADISVPEDGQYEVWVTYKNATDSTLPTEMIVRVDGEIPFYELRRVKLTSLWVTDGGPAPVDRYGNEIAPTPFSADVEQETGLTDSTGRIDVPFLFALTAGEHTISFETQDSGAHISAVTLKAPKVIPAYDGQVAAGSNIVIIEGEAIQSRSKSSIRSAGEFNAVLTPYSTVNRVLNHLSGASFDTAGDAVSYAFEVPEDGWYNLDFHYRQSVKVDFPVFLDLYIDGEIPSEAAKLVHMDYSTGFLDKTVPVTAGSQDKSCGRE